MESLVQWYAENGSALWTTIIGFLSANLIALIGMAFGWLKTKLAAIKQSEAFRKDLEQLYADFKVMLEANKSDIIAACDANTAKRIEKMEKLSEKVQADNDALIPAETTTDAAKALDSLE